MIGTGNRVKYTGIINLKLRKMKTKVSNMTSSRGNTIANQFEITTEKGVFFQSYDSIIAFIPKNHPRTVTSATPPGWRIKLDKRTWDYSVTTGKYRNQFLGESKKETEQKIKDGIYILTDLNK